MNILGLFFGVIAVVLGFIFALLILVFFVRGAKSFDQAVHSNPPKALGAVIAGFAIFYLLNLGVLALIGTSEEDALREIHKFVTINGNGGYIATGVLLFGAVLVGFGLKLDEKKNN